MISQDTKDQIEKNAKKYSLAVNAYQRTAETELIERGYIAGATRYAEKLEEKDKEIEKLTEDSRLWKIAHDNCAAHFDEIKKQLESKDCEIELLTKDIKDQGEYLKQMIEINVLNDAFNSGEEWRKNHKVKEGEQFTDYFMRVFEVEKKYRDRELAQLKEIADKSHNALGQLLTSILHCSLHWEDDLDMNNGIKNAQKQWAAYAEWCKQNLE